MNWSVVGGVFYIGIGFRMRRLHKAGGPMKHLTRVIDFHLIISYRFSWAKEVLWLGVLWR